MNPPLSPKNGRSPSQSTAEHQVKSVMPLWQAAETYDLNPTPARCASSGRAVALAGGASR